MHRELFNRCLYYFAIVSMVATLWGVNLARQTASEVQRLRPRPQPMNAPVEMPVASN